MIPGLIDGLFGFGTAIIERLWPDPAEAAEAKRKLLEMRMNGELKQMTGQLEINKIEAGHANIFVAGWRPAVGWICAAAFAYTYVLQPFLIFIVQVTATYTNSNLFDVRLLPELDWGTISALLFGMLGIGAMRSFDKGKGVDTKVIMKKGRSYGE